MNDEVRHKLLQLDLATRASLQFGEPIMAFWVAEDETPRGCFYPRDGDGSGRGMEQLARLAALSEMISMAADAAIKRMSQTAGSSEDAIRLEYLAMRDRARANGYRITERS